MAERIHMNENNATDTTKRDSIRKNSIGKGVIAILATIVVLWLVFGLLGSFLEDGQNHLPTDNTRTGEQSQSLTSSGTEGHSFRSDGSTQNTPAISPGDANSAMQEPTGTQARPGASLTPESQQ
ncbi:hypothetical protein [Bartonella sp. LJL80]